MIDSNGGVMLVWLNINSDIDDPGSKSKSIYISFSLNIVTSHLHCDIKYHITRNIKYLICSFLEFFILLLQYTLLSNHYTTPCRSSTVYNSAAGHLPIGF